MYLIVNAPLFIIEKIKYSKTPINKVKLLCTIDDIGQVINYIVKEGENEYRLIKDELILDI